MSKPRIPTARDLMQSVPFTFSPDTELLAAIERPRSIEDMQKTFASHSREQLVGRLGRKT